MKNSLSDKFVNKNQKIRDFLFKNILKLLTNLNINANHLSNLKLIVFLPFLFVENLKIAFLFILLSVLVDLFDGPLARYQKKFSDKGKFVDILGDFAIYLLVILSLYLNNLFNNTILVYHLFIFPLIAVLSTIRRNEFVKTDWIIKSAPALGHFNGLVYLALFLFVYLNVDYLNLVVLLLNIYYSLLAVYYFIFIQFRWHNL